MRRVKLRTALQPGIRAALAEIAKATNWQSHSIRDSSARRLARRWSEGRVYEERGGRADVPDCK